MLVGPDLSDRAGEERGLGAGDLRDLLSGNQMAKGELHPRTNAIVFPIGEISAHGLYHFIFARRPTR